MLFSENNGVIEWEGIIVDRQRINNALKPILSYARSKSISNLSIRLETSCKGEDLIEYETISTFSSISFLCYHVESQLFPESQALRSKSLLCLGKYFDDQVHRYLELLDIRPQVNFLSES